MLIEEFDRFAGLRMQEAGYAQELSPQQPAGGPHAERLGGAGDKVAAAGRI